MRQELSRGYLFGVSVFAACAVIHKGSRAIAKQKRQFLSIPGNLAGIKRKFYDVGHFPGVIGAIDCTRVRGSYVQRKRMLWHLLTESNFTPSASKPFVIAMPLFL